VTAEAERHARQAIRRARRHRPGARIIVTGCAAQIDPARFAAMPEVDRVLGNQEKLSVDAYRGGDGARVQVDDIMSIRETAAPPVADFQGRTRAFVQVQQGCDHRCTFCVIPFGRGNSRSVPIGAVVSQVQRQVASGYREVVLTGVDLTAYGRDLPGGPTLGQLVRRLLALVPGLARLRLSSLDPAEVDAELMRLFVDEPRLMPHLHLSLQAGNDVILKRMKRRHRRADAVALTDRVRRLRPDITFGADLIAGFPTETEAMFRDTLALVDDCGLGFLHVFPFSARAGTPAARMPQLPRPVRKERAERLRAAGAAALSAYLNDRLGTVVRVLVEDRARGRSEPYAQVRIVEAPAAATPAGAIVEARATAVDGHCLVGRLAA
jgi:threonylcarbamoyladenosine tRNA methylthiotransferase MtaB